MSKPPPRILVIDDEASIHDAFRLALHRWDVDVLSATDGRQGIEMAAAANPDLIFLDLRMPGIDGISTLREILKENPAQQVSVLTAFAEEFMTPLRRAADDGLRFELIRKPLNAEQVRTVVQSKLPNRGLGGS